MKELVEIKNLSFAYNDKKNILNNVNLKVISGDFLAIIGSNGSGKTTLIKIILGRLKNYKGIISRNCNEISYVGQNNHSEYFPATVFEIVMLSLTKDIGIFKFPKKEHIEKVKKALMKVNMLDYSNKMIGELSGGQRQRVMIAKAIVKEPEIIILDEPTNWLDKESVEDLFNILIKLNEEQNITIIMISHDIINVKKFCSRILLIEEGGIKDVTI